MFNIPFFKTNKKICIKPFTNIEIDNYGDVYTCCPAYIKLYKIGNIWDKNIKSIDDIWYSKEACNLRKKLLKNDYSLCDLNICKEIRFDNNKKIYKEKPPLPEVITLAYDKECNIQCITCRDEKIKNSPKEEALYNQKIDSILLPLLSNAKSIKLNGSGELFYSKHSKHLIKRLTEVNKEVRFTIQTNGILFNKINYENLGLKNRIENLYVSLHALDEELYKKIMVGSNLQIVLENLKWASELQKNSEIERVFITIVVSALNYKEIPKMLELAQKLNIWISYSVYYPWGTKLDENYENLAVWNKNHPEHLNFINIIKKIKEVNYDKCSIPPIFEELIK